MAIQQLTVRQLVLELARAMGDLLAEGTATAGSTSQLDDATNLTFEETNEIEGAWVAIHTGAGIGDERNIATFVVANNRITPRANFSATIGTTSKYLITRQWRPQQYLDAVAAAVRRAQHRALFPLDDLTGYLHEQITMGDLLSTDGNANGQFEDTSGTFPTGWTIDGNTTMAAETGVDNVRRGRSSAKMTSDGTNLAKISQSIKRFERHAGHTLNLYAVAKPDTANRCLLRVGDGGVSTAVTDTHADGADVWEELKAELTTSANLKGLDIDLEISAGAAVNAYWDDVRLICEECTIYEYDLPSRLAYLSKVEQEIAEANTNPQRENAWFEIDRRCWKVQRGASPKLVFIPEYFTPQRNVHLRLTGQVYPATITSTTPATAWAENVEAHAEYVKTFAQWYLLNSLPLSAKGELTLAHLRMLRDTYMEMEHDMQVYPMPGSELVQVPS